MVYVGKNKYKVGRMIMSHMAADTLEELHKMADRIGVHRRHFQNKPGKPHYDVCSKKKKQAIEAGAKLVSDKEIVRLFNRL